MNLKATKYVLVQHSAWGYANNPQFIAGLELRTVSGQKLLAKLEAMGVAIYPDYASASEASYEFMYPEGYEGMIPVAERAGTFARAAVDGLRVFIPTRQEVAA